MLVEVALPVPLPRTFTYAFNGTDLLPGTRVQVPFGPRSLIGWVTRESDNTDVEQVREIERVLDATPTLPLDLLRLCEWTAEYYVVPLGHMLRSALPIALSDPARRDAPDRTRRVLRITRELPSLIERDELFRRAPRQRECYELVESIGGSADVAHLTQQAGFSAAVINGLVQRDVAEIAEEEVHRDPFAQLPAAAPEPLTPTAAQRTVLERLVLAARAPDTAKPFLLRGVTGSGKTLVYIELLKEIVQRQKRGAIVLVPEIALTPQTVARFRSHFGDDVAVLHSALSDGERYDAWRALRRGQRRIAVGARSAIFAPVQNLGAVILDEEHEATYKQAESPRYHARDLAIVRARIANAVCLLGSATPSLESWRNVQNGKFELVELPERVENRPLPPVRILDMRTRPVRDPRVPHALPQQRESAPAERRILSAELVDAIHERLHLGEQTILLLNRRGYSTFVHCRACGHVWHCPNCNVSLTYHRNRRRVICHYCMHEEAAPEHCSACGSDQVAFKGVGTEQVERTVAETFPAVRIARMDVDTTSAKWSHHRILSRFESGEIDILLGTQMIAKGLDFPRVTLVGVVNADVSMNLPDFRAAERTFQLLTQVAGRAGRGTRGGEVFVQTMLPGHYAIRAAAQHDYALFAERELAERRTPLYPPYCRLANIVVSGLDEDAVRIGAEEVAEFIRPFADTAQVELVGPAPCPVDRVRGRWRWHFLLRTRSARALARACRALAYRNPLKPGRAQLRVILDRDPVSLL